MKINRYLLQIALLLILVNIELIYGRSLQTMENYEDNTTKNSVIPEFPFDIERVLNDAHNVFSNVVGKMVANKRFLGLDTNWHW